MNEVKFSVEPVGISAQRFRLYPLIVPLSFRYTCAHGN